MFGRRDTDALPGVGGANQRCVHELQAAFFGEEARYSFSPSSLLDETPFNQIGGAYVFSVAPGDAQVIEQGLQVVAEGGAQTRTVFAKAFQHISSRGFTGFAGRGISNGLQMGLVVSRYLCKRG